MSHMSFKLHARLNDRKVAWMYAGRNHRPLSLQYVRLLVCKLRAIKVNTQSFSSSFPRVVCNEFTDETSGVCSAVSSVMNSSSSYFLYLIQNTTVWTASTMAGAAQIQTRFGSLIAGVKISPKAEERAVVNRKSDLVCMLDYATNYGIGL